MGIRYVYAEQIDNGKIRTMFSKIYVKFFSVKNCLLNAGTK